jgi:multidrug efflux system outer membrane protein
MGMKLSVGLLPQYVTQVLARAIVCGMLLVLPSCEIIPRLRQAEPAPALPASFNGAASSENSAQLGIEQFFNDPMLLSLLDQALLGNRELRILEEEVQIARNEILARQGAYLPFVTFGAGTGLDRPSLFTPLGTAEKQLEFQPGKHFPDPLGNFLGGFNFFWQLDIWRELRNARDAAGQRYLAAMERRNYFVTRLVAEIAENYYELMALDQRLQTLNKTIEIQEESRKIAKARMEAGRGTELAVQRFQAEVRKNQSEKLIVNQEIIEAENRINFLVNRFPQPVERMSAGFFDLKIHALSVGVPAQLLENRPDIRQAERELEAAGLDVQVARAHFFPKVDITAGVGYQAFSPQYLFNPEALIYAVAGNLVAPVINLKAIKAEYQSANAKQLQTVYNYQRVILNAFTEVINRLSMVENYSKSIDIKKQQLQSLQASVDSATKLFLNARVEYVEVLLAQRDLLEARTVLIETKKRQLSAIVKTYQALGGGALVGPPKLGPPVEIVPPEGGPPSELLPEPRALPENGVSR